MKAFFTFIMSAILAVFTGSIRYYIWLGCLVLFMAVGALSFLMQFQQGLGVTGLTDHVGWGIYICNFIFFVGVAAAGVMLAIPAFVLKDPDFPVVVPIGASLAVAAIITAILFVMADLGEPLRFWHMLPLIGFAHFPDSMLTWDVLMLSGYLFLNLSILAYFFYVRYHGLEINMKFFVPGMIFSAFWGVGIELVPAFLLMSSPDKHYWNSAILGPRFLASAFAAGPALLVIIFIFLRKITAFQVPRVTIQKLSRIMLFAGYANLVMLLSEVFKEFYWPTEHSQSAQYLFFGLDGKFALTPIIWTSVASNILAVTVLSMRSLREKFNVLVPSCLALFAAIWVEKGLGLVIPGFIPSPLGEVVEYLPTPVEILVSLGVISFGLFVLTALLKVFIHVETGDIRHRNDFEIELDTAFRKQLQLREIPLQEAK